MKTESEHNSIWLWLASKVNVTLGPLKLKPAGYIRGTERNLEITPNLGLEPPRLDQPKLKPHPKPQLRVDPVYPRLQILVQILPISAVKHHQALSLELTPHLRRVLVPLVERRHVAVTESLVSVVSPDLDLVVVDADAAVRVPDREVEVEVVAEVVVRAERELRELGVGDVELDGVWSED